MSTQTFSHASFFSQLKRYYSFYTGGFLLFLGALAVAEQMGMSRAWIGYSSCSRPSACTPASAG